jgi:predicted permease
MKRRLPRVFRRLLSVVTWGAQDDDMDQEMAFHVDAITREYVRAGMSDADAARAARKRFGSTVRHKEAGHDARTGYLDQFAADVRSGIRQLVNARGFAIVAIVTLALGVGVNTAVFTVVKSVLLDALPYADADQLVRIHGGAAASTQGRGPLSAGTVEEIAARQQSFTALAAFVDVAIDAVYGREDGPQITTIAWVEPKFFDTLGVSPPLGRTFRNDDAADGLVALSGGAVGTDTGAPVMLSHAAWARLFGTDATVIGREVRINGLARTVIGVLPPGFIAPMGDVDFYIAFDRGPVVANPVAVRRAQWLGLVGRLDSGVTQDMARRDVERIWTDLAREYPADNGTLRASAMPLRDAMVGDTRPRLLVLMAGAALVLVITCANLAATLLARALSRRKEFALRAALGAGRARVVRQLLTESVVLAFAGGVAGLLTAVAVLNVLRDLAARALPVHANLSLDSGALLASATIALGTGLLFGVAPAAVVVRGDAQHTLRADSRGSTEGRQSRRARGMLVAGQMALCVSLLVGAGLLTRSLWAMADASLGFVPDSVLTGAIQLPVRDYADPESRLQFREQFEQRLRALPGVQSVATATSVPTRVRQRMGVTPEGTPASEAQPFVLAAVVSDDYFRTLQISLRQGRTFDARDRADAPPTLVISETMARRFWPTGNAVGSRLRLGPDPASPLIEVIGIVSDVRNDRARRDAEPMAYRSMRQLPAPLLTILVRTKNDPLTLTRSVEQELAALDRNLPLQQVSSLQAVLDDGLADRRLPVVLMTAFGALALLLSSMGVYSLFASMTAAREREFGVRLALGSRPRAIAVLVLRQGAGWMAAGLLLGAVGIFLVARLVRELLYGVPPFDPLTIGAAVAVLMVCAIAALLGPLYRAARVDAVVALRSE